MKRIILVICIFLLFIKGYFYTQLNYSYNLYIGYKECYIDAKGEGFFKNLQIGYGISYGVQISLLKVIGLELILPSFEYYLTSNVTNDYFYPERFVFNNAIKLKLFLPSEFIFHNFQLLKLIFGFGYRYSYHLLSTYYFPRYFIDGLEFDLGLYINIIKEFSLGFVFNYVNYNDNLADFHYLYNYMIVFTHNAF